MEAREARAAELKRVEAELAAAAAVDVHRRALAEEKRAQEGALKTEVKGLEGSKAEQQERLRILSAELVDRERVLTAQRATLDAARVTAAARAADLETKSEAQAAARAALRLQIETESTVIKELQAFQGELALALAAQSSAGEDAVARTPTAELLDTAAAEAAGRAAALGEEETRLAAEIGEKEMRVDAAEARASGEWRACNEVLEAHRLTLRQLETHASSLAKA